MSKKNLLVLFLQKFTLMFSQLPTEIIYLIFNELKTPNDHVQFSRLSRTTYALSHHVHVRTKLLRLFFDPSAVSSDIYPEVIRLIESSHVRPHSHNMLHVLEQIETSHFVTFGYTSLHAKATILELFRPKCQQIKDKLMNSDNKPVTTLRQLTSTGPRRIYYDLSIPFDNHNKLFKCVFYDLETVVAFDETYTAHHGTMRFEDEHIVSDMSWQSIFTASLDERQHIILQVVNHRRQDVAISCLIHDI
jgi:hypothetical protein